MNTCIEKGSRAPLHLVGSSAFTRRPPAPGAVLPALWQKQPSRCCCRHLNAQKLLGGGGDALLCPGGVILQVEPHILR